MLLFNYIKNLFFIFLILSTSSSCRYWQNISTSNSPKPPLETQKTDNNFLFSTQEPKDYQAEIVIKANDEEQLIFVARKDEKRLLKYDIGEKSEFAIVSNEMNKYLIHSEKRIYAENETLQENKFGENWFDFLTNEKLNQTNDLSFESLGMENNLAKYRIISGESEAFIWVDESTKLPLKQEFVNSQKQSVFTIEIKNLKFETEVNLFEIPKEYKKLSVKEFQEIIQNADNN
jgi:outer membrane lipoprotein-sorting protein